MHTFTTNKPPPNTLQLLALIAAAILASFVAGFCLDTRDWRLWVSIAILVVVIFLLVLSMRTQTVRRDALELCRDMETEEPDLRLFVHGFDQFVTYPKEHKSFEDAKKSDPACVIWSWETPNTFYSCDGVNTLSDEEMRELPDLSPIGTADLPDVVATCLAGMITSYI